MAPSFVACRAPSFAVASSTEGDPPYQQPASGFEAFVLARSLCPGYSQLHIDSLRIAFDALAGDKNAVQVFEKICQRCATRNSVDRSHSFRDELKQELMVQLMVSPRKLNKYQGRGSLMQWISSMTHTIAVGMKTVSWREQASSAQLFRRLSEVKTPESLLEERQTNSRLRRTFQAAFSRLSSREQQVLHMRYVQNKTDAQIAVDFSVHRTSVVRWLAHARKVLSKETHRALQANEGAFEHHDVLLSFFIP